MSLMTVLNELEEFDFFFFFKKYPGLYENLVSHQEIAQNDQGGAGEGGLD